MAPTLTLAQAAAKHSLPEGPEEGVQRGFRAGGMQAEQEVLEACDVRPADGEAHGAQQDGSVTGWHGED